MQKRMIASVLALAGMSLAGGVAADNGDDCTYGTTPLPGGFYNACIFEENAGSHSYDFCGWSGCYEGGSTWASNQLANAHVVANAHVSQGVSIPVSTAARASATQSEGSGWERQRDFFGTGSTEWANAFTRIYAWNSLSTPFLGTGGSVTVYQYDDRFSHCSGWGCYAYHYEGTTVSADRTIGPAYLAAGYLQNSNNGAPCTEHAYVHTHLAGTTTPTQACTAEIPQLMADPNTRFPDYPDGTGLPFL